MKSINIMDDTVNIKMCEKKSIFPKKGGMCTFSQYYFLYKKRVVMMFNNLINVTIIINK